MAKYVPISASLVTKVQNAGNEQDIYEPQCSIKLYGTKNQVHDNGNRNKVGMNGTAIPSRLCIAN